MKLKKMKNVNSTNDEIFGKKKSSGNGKIMKKGKKKLHKIEKKTAFNEAKSTKAKKSQKEYLEDLKKNDPEFYRALMSSKDVMEAVSSGDEESDEEEFFDNPESGGDITDQTMTLSDEDEEEEIGQDEEDTDEEEEEKFKPKKEDNIVTKQKLSKWKGELQNSKLRVPALRNLFQALRAAIESIQGSENFEKISTLIVEGPQSFNDVIRCCLREIAPSLTQIFEGHSDITSAKKWPKLRFAISKYLKDLILLTQSITEPSVIVVILKKGILPLLPFYLKFKFAQWDLFRHLASLWCTSEESVRVLAFIAIFRLLRAFQTDALKDKSLRLLYMKYVKNCRFTSPFTLPLIDFMRVCLVELYSLDHAMAYRHCFIYVRQLAFHLRNALISRKPDQIQNVYNWQYVHCLELWCELLGKTHPSPVLKPLIYPLTQIANGTIQLSKVNRHIPLVFHVCNMLTDLSHRTSTFIPILPYLLEILLCPRLKKKALKDSASSLNWDCIIKIAASQFDEEAFTYGVIDQLYNSFYKYLSTECHTIGFPELVFPATIQLKDFLKKCAVAVFTRKMRQLLDKIEENSKYILNRRRGVTFTIADTKVVHDWEIACRQSEPPILKFYEHLKTVKKDPKDLTGGFKLEDLKRSKHVDAEDRFALQNIRKRERDGDDDGEEEEERMEEKKQKRKEKKKLLKKQKEAEMMESPVKEEVKEEEVDDIVEEMRLSDIDDSDVEIAAGEESENNDEESDEDEEENNEGGDSSDGDVFEDSDDDDDKDDSNEE